MPQPPLSKSDKRFLEITAERKQLSNKHYELPLPFKENLIELECNISMAEQRISKRKPDRDVSYKQEYTSFMNEMITNEFCEAVPPNEISSTPSWYIPHHGVFHRV